MLELDCIEKRYGGAVALDRLDLSLELGEVMCVVGPSGCGKSTLLRIVAGVETPDAGEVRLGGAAISRSGWSLPPERRGLNMVFQDYALWPHMTVARIVGYGLRHLSGGDRATRVGDLLKLMQIEPYADRLPGQLSGGQQQRVAIARALATDPKLLLFDEPLSNLDVQLRMEMREEFADLFSRLGKTVVYVTHDPLEACAFAHRLLVMRAGRVEQSGSPQELFADPRSPWVATLAGYDTSFAATAGVSAGQRLRRVHVGSDDFTVRVPPREWGEPAEGSRMTVMLNPSTLRVADAQSRGSNRLRGLVVRSLFEGHRWRLSLDLADGARIAVMADGPATTGSLVEIAFDPADAIAFETGVAGSA